MVKYETIIQIIDTYIEKCSRNGPKNSSGLQTTSSDPQINDGGLTVQDRIKIGEDLAKRFNLEISIGWEKEIEIDEYSFVFWDDENSTVISLSGLIKHQDWVDFTNQGKGLYNLDEVMEYYVSMPPLMKDAVTRIQFIDNSNGCYITEGNNNIYLSSDLFTAKQEGDKHYNLQRALYHECGHAVDFKYSLEDTKRIGGISGSEDYDNMMNKNNKSFASEYSRNFYLNNITNPNKKNIEDFADTMSMVAFDGLNDKTNAQVISTDHIIEDISSFKKNHKNTYEFAKNILYGKVKLIKREGYEDKNKYY